MMNLVVLQGNLTRDPEMKYIDGNNGKVAVCNFSIATNRHYRTKDGEKQQETTFIDCEAWDSGAETISKYMKKGEPFLVRGSLKNDSWETADGQKRTKIRLRVEDFELPPRRSRPNSEVDESANSAAVLAPTETPTDTKNGDDIPF